MPLRPVLTGNVVGDLIEERSRDAWQRRHAREFTPCPLGAESVPLSTDVFKDLS